MIFDNEYQLIEYPKRVLDFKKRHKFMFNLRKKINNKIIGDECSTGHQTIILFRSKGLFRSLIIWNNPELSLVHLWLNQINLRPL